MSVFRRPDRDRSGGRIPVRADRSRVPERLRESVVAVREFDLAAALRYHWRQENARGKERAMAIQPYPDRLFDPATRHMMVFAHQDDEIMYTGLMQRLGPELDFLWVTNGDGLAPFVDADPAEYAKVRIAETDRVLEVMERDLSRKTDLEVSEIEIYDNFVDLTLNPSRKPEIYDFFHDVANRIYAEIRRVRPEVIWTAQYQNGHPEHDLVHFLTAYAIRQLEREENRKIDFYQLPEYEYTILIPMRFHPLYKGIRHEILLTDAELEKKRQALECYPSQVELFEKFEKVINGLGRVARLFGRGFDAEGFVRREMFGPVPEDLDYSQSTHRFEWANYMRDYNKGEKVSHARHLANIARAIRERTLRVPEAEGADGGKGRT